VRIGYLLDANRREGDAAPKATQVADSMDSMIEEAVLAERAGFHSVAVPDRHREFECRFPGPEQLLALLARETARVALGSFTFVGTLVHPMKAAEQFAVIDNLSRGRLFTTVSRGFLPAFWGQFGIPEERMLGRFQETLRIWRRAFEGERFDFDGKHWQVRDGMLAPQPYQYGGWPIWGGGNASAVAARRAADYAECWTCDPLPLADEVWEERVGAYRERALERGKRPFVVLMRDGWVADSFEQAAREFGEHFATVARFYFRKGQLAGHPDFRSEADVTPERLAPHLVMGTPEQCRERLEWLREERGVDYVMLCCRLTTGPSFEATREQILRLGDEVARPLHEKYPSAAHPAIPQACL
jgi:alkanesulfonate monooxygenase SsuD/methylene tetrahydromethanopterin reductase-like flavin-dependent oxidoreductase (luciferase family)